MELFHFIFYYNKELCFVVLKGKVHEKKVKKKLTSVSFMYVCVAENAELLVFFYFFPPDNSLIDNSLSE